MKFLCGRHYHWLSLCSSAFWQLWSSPQEELSSPETQWTVTYGGGSPKWVQLNPLPHSFVRDTNLQQEGHRLAAYLTLQPGQWGQASLAEPRRFPPDFTGELRGQKPPRLRLLQEAQNYLRRGRVWTAGHIKQVIRPSCEQLVLETVQKNLSNLSQHNTRVQFRKASVRKHWPAGDRSALLEALIVEMLKYTP